MNGTVDSDRRRITPDRQSVDSSASAWPRQPPAKVKHRLQAPHSYCFASIVRVKDACGGALAQILSGEGFTCTAACRRPISAPAASRSLSRVATCAAWAACSRSRRCQSAWSTARSVTAALRECSRSCKQPLTTCRSAAADWHTRPCLCVREASRRQDIAPISMHCRTVVQHQRREVLGCELKTVAGSPPPPPPPVNTSPAQHSLCCCNAAAAHQTDATG